MNSAAEVAELTASALFDREWYVRVYPDVAVAAVDPLEHWCQFGWREGRNPNLYFGTTWYLHRNPDVAAAQLNPLLHYVRHGDREGRQPMPYFDPAWYRTAYGIPDGDIALRHFLASRSTGRYVPMPELYAVPLLPAYRPLAEADEDPFARALEDAEREGREASPDQSIVVESGLLDPNYYLINGSDVHDAGLDPVQHFCRFGWREGRKPNLYFDTNWYLRTNPSVARLGINPLVHYILEGERAGRRPIIYFDPAWYRECNGIAAEGNALAHYLVHRRTQTYSPNPLFDAAWYLQRMGTEIGPNRDPFAHYLQAGMLENVDPSPRFNAAEYRQRHLGRPSRAFRHLMRPDKHNPLVHYLEAQYR
jgi:hypothetical protein